MHRENETEVLVVGGGPVGMFTAALLAESGVAVEIIDQERRTTTHSYACALHSSTLALLDRIGLAEDVIKLGRRIGTIALYDGESRRAELDLAELSEDFPFLVSLPQSILENLLEKNLKRNDRVKIHWNHRLTDLQDNGQTAVATIDKLARSAKGYVVPEWDWEVEKSLETRAAFVVGTDGPNSHVRRCLDIDYERPSDPESFAVYEFQADRSAVDEMRIVLADQMANVLWPLPDRKCQWCFQLRQTDEAAEFPMKERKDVVIKQPAIEAVTRHDVQKLIRERAPWFEATVKELDWSAEVQFEHRLAKQFGRGRCWLAGDAAHQTGPVGVQSMNVGLREAADLATTLEKILRKHGSMNLLEAYDREWRGEWQRLLGVKGGLRPARQADPWLKAHAAKILPCIPASGDDLKRLAKQLGLEFRSRRMTAPSARGRAVGISNRESHRRQSRVPSYFNS